MLIQLIPEEVLLRINAHPFYFLIHIFELKPKRKESSIVNFIYNLHIPKKKNSVVLNDQNTSSKRLIETFYNKIFEINALNNKTQFCFF